MMEGVLRTAQLCAYSRAIIRRIHGAQRSLSGLEPEVSRNLW